jgi:hypothetical protein
MTKQPKIILIPHFISLYFGPFVYIFFVFDFFLKQKRQRQLDEKNKSMILK